MKKFLLAISFVLSFAVIANAQAKKTTAADAPATEKAQPGDANYTPPTSVAPQTVDVKEAGKAKKGAKKACSKAKECKKGKSCCKKGKANKAKASAKKGKGCCKEGAKACGKHAKKDTKTSATESIDKPTKAAPAAPTVEN